MYKGAEFIIPAPSVADVFTRKDLSDEHTIIEATVEKFVEENLLTKEAVEIIEEKKDFSFSRDLIQRLGELGFLGIDIPESFGGAGLDKISSIIVTEAISKQGSFACTFGADTGIGSWPIIFFGSEGQKKKYLPKIASGEYISAYSLTEAGAGSDAASAQATATPAENGSSYIINGEKIFVTNGGLADIFIVFAQAKGAGLTAFIVEKTFPGVAPGKEEHKIGIRGSSTTALTLQNVRVPAENMLGKPGEGLKIALNTLNLGRFKLGAGCLGAARLCFAEALAYAKERKQFGKPIREFGLIREKLAAIAVKIFAMEAIVYRTAALLEESIGAADANYPVAVRKAIERLAIECSIVKVFCSEALGFITDNEVQIFGGAGFCEEYPAARHWRDARINRIFEGTNEINRLVIMQMLVKKMLKGELALLPLMKQYQEEITQPTLPLESDEPLEQLLFYLNSAKKCVLLAVGANMLKFQAGLQDHQSVIGIMSDCLIRCYVLDSALAAFAKKRALRDEAIVRMLFAELLTKTRTGAENLFASCFEGDGLRVALSATRKLFKFPPQNLEALAETILANL